MYDNEVVNVQVYTADENGSGYLLHTTPIRCTILERRANKQIKHNVRDVSYDLRIAFKYDINQIANIMNDGDFWRFEYAGEIYEPISIIIANWYGSDRHYEMDLVRINGN
jgi:hypothetical protein